MATPVDPKTNHGFYLLGERSLLLSHIPMFMAPHQAQLSLEVSLSAKDGTDQAQAYRTDKKKTGTQQYVMVSDPLVLPTLAPDAAKPLTSFTGNLYRGWPFDQQWNLNPAQLFIPSLTIKVTRAIYYRSLVNPTPLANLSYYCFRTKESVYLEHTLSEPPDFKHILTARVDGLDAKAHQGALELEFPGIANKMANKLRPKQQLNAVIDQGGYHLKVLAGAALIYDDDPQHLGEHLLFKI